MTAEPKLKLVAKPPIDIQSLNRADIEKRDWSACHVAGDKGPVLTAWDRIRRPWRK